MIERYLSIIEISQKQAYIFGSNKLRDNVTRSAQIWLLTEPEQIDRLIGEKEVFDYKKDTVYAGGGHTVLSFDSYDRAVEFAKRYTFLLHGMIPDIEVFTFTLPCSSKVAAKRMLEHVFEGGPRSHEKDEEFAQSEAERHNNIKTHDGDGAQDSDAQCEEDFIKECAPGKYLDALVEGLERKKALRISSFHQGSFGVENIDSDTRSVMNHNEGTNDTEIYDRSCYDGSKCSKETQALEAASFKEIIYGKKAHSSGSIEQENVDRGVNPVNPVPSEYEPVFEFEKIGGSKGDVNFLAVIHIDGNGMGARCKSFYGKCNNEYVEAMKAGCADDSKAWEEFRKAVSEFSKGIDDSFKEALKKTFEHVGKSIQDGKLNNLSLDKDENTGKPFFPMRGIIASGDDICFVTDGRIGIECAAIFLKELANQNVKDQLPFSASAGVVIVHQKYPLFRAYALAEGLCKNAKSFAADLRKKQDTLISKSKKGSVKNTDVLKDNGAGICAIDWHLEMGEIGKDVDEIRKEYRVGRSEDKKKTHLEMRPYIVTVTNDIEMADADASDNSKFTIQAIEPHRQFDSFLKQMKAYLEKADSDKEVHSKLKELKTILRKGKTETEYYIGSHRLKGLVIDNYYQIIPKGESLVDDSHLPIYVTTADGIERSVIFDAAEALEIFSGIMEE